MPRHSGIENNHQNDSSSINRKKSNFSDEQQHMLSTRHSSSSSSSADDNNEKSPLLGRDESEFPLAQKISLLFNEEEAAKIAQAQAYCPTNLLIACFVVAILSAINSIVTYSLPHDKHYVRRPWTSASSFNPENSSFEMAIFDVLRSIVVIGFFWSERFNGAFYASVWAVICSIGKFWVFRDYTTDSVGDVVVNFVVLGASLAQCVIMYLGARFHATEGMNKTYLFKLLWPFFVPRQWKDRFTAILMWIIVVLAQFCTLYAPLQLAHIVLLMSNPNDGSGGLESYFHLPQHFHRHQGGSKNNNIIVVVNSSSSNESTTTTTTTSSAAPDADGGFYINSHQLAGAITIYVFLRFIPKILNEFRDLCYTHIWKSAYDEISLTLFHHLHSLPYDFHLNKQLGVLVQSVQDGTNAADNLVHKLFILLVPSLVATFAAFLVFALHLEVPLITGIGYLGTSTYIFATVVMTNTKKSARDEFAEAFVAVKAVFTDALLNFETIKVFGKEFFFGEKYRRAVEYMTSTYIKARHSHSSIDFVQSTLFAGTRYGCLLIAGLAISENWVVKSSVNGEPTMMTVAKFVAINEYLSSIFEPLEKLTSIFMEIVRSLIELKDIVHLYSLPTDEMGDDEDPNAFDLTKEKQTQRVCKTLHFKKIDPVTGKEIITEEEICLNHARGLEVEFRNVSFTYPGALHRSLDGVSFKIPACTSVGICGLSGGGKSSIFKLLLRFYEPEEGEILIAGRNIKNITKSSIREVIGTVSQTSTLIDDSFANNILFGHANAKEEDAEAIVKQVQLDGLVNELPDGCSSLVGKGKLSGGEVQRIALARALLKDPLIFLADEHTASLDLDTEREIMNATESFIEGEGRTSIYITHRLHTIVHVDQILVLDHGKIVDRGTHEELIQREDGLYHRMWMHQLGGDEAHHHHHHHHNEEEHQNGNDQK